MKKRYLAFLLVSVLAFLLFTSGCTSTIELKQSANIKADLEEKGGVRVVLTPKSVKEDKTSKSEYEAAIAIMDYRLKNFGCNKRSITIDDSGNIVVEIVYNTKMGNTNIESAIENAFKPGLFTIQEVDENKKDNNGAYMPTDKIIVDGIEVKDAKAIDNKDKGINIMVELTEKASKDFEEATGRLVGRPLGIFLDRQLISAPVIQSKITGGKLVISGQGNKEQALKLITIIKSGPLPLKLEPTSIQAIPSREK